MIAPEARGAWNEIEARLRSYVTRRVASDDVDDVLQEIFVKINGGITHLRDGERFGGWVYRIAKHVIADFGRARQRDPLAKSVEPPEEPNVAEELDDAQGLQADLSECVALFVARLAVAVPGGHHSHRARRPDPEGCGRHAGHLAVRDEVTGTARSRKDSRHVRAVLPDLGRLPRSGRGVQSTRARGNTRGLPRSGGFMGHAARARGVTAFEIATMTDADTCAVVALLEQCDLLTSGVSENLPGFLVARSNGKVIASAGVETYGAFGLLRSIAVDRARRREGIAAVLVRQALERAARDHVTALYLLTTTAAKYFERFGFLVCSRDDAPDGIRKSWEFRAGCPATAVSMSCRISAP